jgi:malate dehydrogenase
MYSSARRVATRFVTQSNRRNFHSSLQNDAKVSVVGASGGIGQPLSMLLKLDPLVTELSLYDIVNTPGVAADLSHIPTNSKASGFKGTEKEEMEKALTGSEVIVIPAGVPRKPGMTRDDLFNTNASIVKGIAEVGAKVAPNASYCIISNPVNSTVPIFAETFKKSGVYDPKKLFGVTTLDIIRANTFVAENQKLDATKLDVPVIGGHAGTTILPLLSQVPGAKFSQDDLDKLTHRIQFGGDEVVQAKDGTGSATLSMAYAGYLFAQGLLRAKNGEKVKMCSFVENNLTEAPFFSTPITLGPNGIEEIHPFGELSDFEKEGLAKAVPDLIKQAQKGIDFVKNN